MRQQLLERMCKLELSFKTNLRQTVQDEVAAQLASRPPVPVVPVPPAFPQQATTDRRGSRGDDPTDTG